MDVTPLVSVIVPIYNVEKYVRKCLDSLRGQTLKEIEVICIDDGSTDESGRIADEYARADERFRVLHTENRGLSAARNRGIDEAKSEWLMFVDSDDWVSEDFCRIPYEAGVEENADLVIFDRCLVTESGKIKHEMKWEKPRRIIDSETAIDIGWPAVWNKTYQRSLFDEIRYPEGQVYEELLTTHKIVYKAKRIISIPDKLYHYRTKRNGGITHSVDNDSEWLRASAKQVDELIKLGYNREKAQANLWRTALKCCGRARSIDDAVYIEASKIIRTVKWFPSGFSLKEKMMIMVWKIDRRLYRTAYKVARKRS